MKKNKVNALVALALSATFALSSVSLVASAAEKKASVTVESKSGTETTAKKTKLSSFPYGTRIKASDAAAYKVSDFIDDSGKIKKGYDSKADAKLVQLNGSNWYHSASLSHLLERYYFNYNAHSVVRYDEARQETPVEEASTADVVEATTEEAVAEPETTGVAPAMMGAGGSDFSTTTVQTEGVDEADIIKTDGQTIYYLDRSRGVAVIQAGNKPKQIANITPVSSGCNASFSYSDMYISGTTLIIVCDQWGYIGASSGQSTSIYFYDVKTPAKPILSRTVTLSGSNTTTRFFNNTLYVINTMYLNAPSSSTLDTVLPLYSDSLIGKDSYVLPPQDIYLSTAGQDNSFSFNLIATVPLHSAMNAPKAYATSGYYGDAVYMSKESLVLSSTNYGYTTPVPYDKALTYTVRSGQSSTLNRFSIGKDGLEFAAMGSIPGILVNQYALDEYDGTIRAAATENSNKISSGLFVFEAATMKEIGKVTNIAPGESIQSVRFSVETAYMVTFEQIDPFFVIDLSKPKSPKVVGELKIPGFSTYLHPYGKNRVIGLGFEVSNTYVKNPDGSESITGTTQNGLKVSMFDVSNPQKPKELHKLNIGSVGTYSEATSNPKSIMFDMDKGIMAFPVAYSDNRTVNGKTTKEDWSGGLVVEFSPKGFEMGAKIKLDDYYGYQSRFVYIGNTLYYLSSNQSNQLVAMNYDNYKILSTLDLKF